MDQDDELAVSRFKALTSGMKPKGARRPGREISGVAKWVRRLFDELEQLVAAGWAYEEIAQSLDQAAIPLNDGACWSEGAVRTAMSRERRRRREGERSAPLEPAEAPKPVAITQSAHGAKAVPKSSPSDTEAADRADAPGQPPKRPGRLNFAPRNGGGRSGLLTKE